MPMASPVGIELRGNIGLDDKAMKNFEGKLAIVTGGGESFLINKREEWDRTFGVCWFGATDKVVREAPEQVYKPDFRAALRKQLT